MLAALLFGPYRDFQIEGWTVKVEAALVDQEQWKSVRRELENQLYRIGRVVPDAPLAKLKTIKIWIHINDPITIGAAYHPGADWLKEHGANPDMAKGLELGNAKNFVSWTYEQPWMILHELAHGYHDQFLPEGFGNEDVAKVYKAAMESKKYESVRHWNGSMAKHYGTNNPMEFFAESTEAFFGQNDFFPFVNAELKNFDPDTYSLLTTIWGTPQKRP